MKINIFVAVMFVSFISAGCSGIKSQIHDWTAPSNVATSNTDIQSEEVATQATNSSDGGISGVTKIGENRYEVEASSMRDPDKAFRDKAMQACPAGYKVLERTRSGRAMVTVVGTVECD